MPDFNRIIIYEEGPILHFKESMTKHEFFEMCQDLKNTLGYKDVVPEPITEGGIRFDTGDANEYKSIRLGLLNAGWPRVEVNQTWANNHSPLFLRKPDLQHSDGGSYLKFFIYSYEPEGCLCMKNAFTLKELKAIFRITRNYGISTKISKIKRPEKRKDA